MSYAKRKKHAPTRFSPQAQHAKYGVENWFKLRGINDKEVQAEIIHRYCEANGFDMKNLNKPFAKYMFIENKFVRFCSFAIAYCIENNYIYS